MITNDNIMRRSLGFPNLKSKGPTICSFVYLTIHNNTKISNSSISRSVGIKLRIKNHLIPQSHLRRALCVTRHIYNSTFLALKEECVGGAKEECVGEQGMEPGADPQLYVL